MGLLGLASCTASLDPEADPSTWPEVSFEPMATVGALPDVTTHRLCVESDHPNQPSDPTFIQCDLETLTVASSPSPKDTITVAAWNLERGHRLGDIISAFQDSDLPLPDVLLLSEADRGCARTDERHVAGEIAEALGMNMVFAVEFLEVDHDGESWRTCEHGNALLSRYELGNVGAIRHQENVSWYTPLGDRASPTSGTRLGGRIAVYADVRVGDRVLRVYSVHFASGADDDPVRAAQAAETADHGADWAAPALVGGDMNAGAYALDLSRGSTVDGVTTELLGRGWFDSHQPLPLAERITQSVLILDLLFSERDLFSNPGVCLDSACGHLSDHLAIWADVTLR